MFLNDNHGRKALARSELYKLIDQYLDNGGTISHSRENKVTIHCHNCGYRKYVSIGYAQSFGRTCKCGGRTRIVWS